MMWLVWIELSCLNQLHSFQDLAMIEAEGVGVTFEVGGGWVDEQGAVVSVETRLS